MDTSPSKATKKATKFFYDLVAITWEDAHSTASWTEIAEVELAPCMATTVGFLVKADADRTLVADSVVEYDNGKIHSISGTTVIPQGMIRDIQVIRKGKGGNA